jgi:hypothetical protein
MDGLAVSVLAKAWVSAVFVTASYGAFAMGNDAVLDPPLDSATSRAFAMQRNGDHAGAPVIMTGDLASAAYSRYLKSFNNPIPQFFGSSLKGSPSTNNSSAGSE